MPGTLHDDPWLLHTTERLPWLRSYLGNGRITAQVVTEGGLAGTQGAPLHLMAELYDRAEGREVEHPVPLPGWSGLRVSFGGQQLEPEQAIAYSQSMDLRRGVAETRQVWQVDGGRAEVTSLQAVLRHEPNLALIRLTLQAEQAGDWRVVASFSRPDPDALRDLESGTQDRYLWCTAHTRERGIAVALAGTLLAGGPARVAPVEAGGLGITVQAPAGVPCTVTWLVAVHSGYTAPDPYLAALADRERAAARGAAALLAGHIAAWERLWQADVGVDGDPEVQRFVRAGLFALLCSLRHDVAASLSPMGLSSLGYNGHVFWDADTWMYPPLLLLHPEIARPMLTYRQQRLPAALARAESEGYAGAMFPWESATDGSETTPSWARTGLKEHHITACVAMAQWHYYLATGDRDWLAAHGWPVIEAAARFWVSRVARNSAGGYEIHDVICADEYAEDVDNNAFTNAAARAALLAAVAAAGALGQAAPPAWRDVADGLVLRCQGDLVLEFDGYDGRIIKQADVELLAYPLEHPLSASSIALNHETYLRVTDPDGPAMGISMYAVVAAQLGRRAEALALFHTCYRPHLFGPFYALAETPTNGAVNFLTGVGGALQALLFGFGGVRPHRTALAVDPLLPEGWQALRFPALHWRERVYTLAILPGDRAVLGVAHAGARLELRLQRWRPGPEPLTVELSGAVGMECVLKAEDWLVEPQAGVTPGWRLWPPAGGPSGAFLLLHLTAIRPGHAPFVLQVEQRVQDGNL